MINTKLEKAIFIIIFIIVIAIVGPAATQIKLKEVAFNTGVTPEELIQSKYPEIKDKNLDYKYIIIRDRLFFVVGGLSENYGVFDDAFKGDRSGFVFILPGFEFNFTDSTQSKFVDLPNGKVIVLMVSKFRSEYIIRIIDSKKDDNVVYYSNSRQLDILTLDNIVNSQWYYVLADLNQDMEIYAITNGEKTHIVNTQEIKKYFGVK